jgi:uncharacterized membrane protein YdbT with pleckstrin-like domain
MPYPRKLLNADETIAVDLHPHWWYFAEAAAALIGSIILAVIALAVLDSGGFKSFVLWVLIAAIVLSAIWLVIRYLKWATTNFVITSDRVVFRHGVIAKSGIEIPLDRVNNVNFNQGIFERMIGAGDLLIESGGEDGQQRFTDVRRPERVQQVIHAQINDMTRRRSGGGGGFAPPAGSGADVAQQLERLEGLRDRGSITPEEFENQKRRLLG